MKYILIVFLVFQTSIQQSTQDPSVNLTASEIINMNDEAGYISPIFYNFLSDENEENLEEPKEEVQTTVQPDESEVLEEAVVDQELDAAGRIISMLEQQTVQPKWILRMGIRNIDIKNRYPSELIDYEKFTSPEHLTVFDSENNDEKLNLQISGVKTSEWCFITFTVLNEAEYLQHEHKYFFHCPYLVDSELDNLYLRELLDECVPPEIVEPEPPVVKKCHWFFKKIDESYKFSVREMGPVDGADMLECYVESVKQMATQPRVEVLCSSEAIEDDAFQSLSREQYEEIVANHTPEGDHTELGTNKFVGSMEKDEKVQIQAS